MPHNHNNPQPLNLMRVSKLISLVLRHKPQEIGLKLDEHGWANVEELLTKIQPRLCHRYGDSRRNCADE